LINLTQDFFILPVMMQKLIYFFLLSQIILSQACSLRIEKALQENIKRNYTKSKNILKSAVKEEAKAPIAYHYVWGKHYLEGQQDTIQAIRHFRKAFETFEKPLLEIDKEVLQRNYIDRYRVIDFIMACQNYPNVLPRVIQLQDSILYYHDLLAEKDSLILAHQEQTIYYLEMAEEVQTKIEETLHSAYQGKTINKQTIEAQEADVRLYKRKAQDLIELTTIEQENKLILWEKIRVYKQKIKRIY